MPERIEAQPAKAFGSLIAHAAGHPAMGQFMHDDGIQKRYSQKHECQGIAYHKLDQAHLSHILSSEDVTYHMPAIK